MRRVMTMYRVFVDSLLNPKALLEHRNKSGWFAFGYAMILIFLMSISSIVYLVGFPWANPVTEESVHCSFVEQKLACEASDTLRASSMFGLSVYFFNEDETIPTTIDSDSIVLQGDTLEVRIEGMSAFSVAIDRLQTGSFDETFSQLYGVLRIAIYLNAFFQNGFFFMIIVLISTMSVMRLRQFIAYKKLFRLVLFASSTIAVLFTFYNLLPLPEWVMFLLLLIGIRPHFLLQRELTIQTMLHLQEQAQSMANDAPPAEEADPNNAEETNDPEDEQSE